MVTTEKTVAAERDERVDIYFDCNLGVFGLLRPERFAGVATGDKVTEAISAILKEVSFPSLNIVFSATGRLLERGKRAMKLGALLQEAELRVTVEPLDQNGNEVKFEAPARPLKILGLEPSETEALKFVPDIGAIPDIPSPLVGVISGIESLLGFGSSLSKIASSFLGSGSSDEPPQPSFVLLEAATIAKANEFAFYLRSKADQLKDGTHFGVAFLQLSRKVTKLRVRATLATDWQGTRIKNQIEDFEVILDVNHPRIPQTPSITDFTATSSIPIVVPRDDVKTLLSIEDAELDELIKTKRLVSFGKESKHITKGSLINLLGL